MAHRPKRPDDLIPDVFIAGHIIDLIAVSEDLVDITDWYRWFNDEETTYYMQKHYFPNNKVLQKKYARDHIEGNQNSLQLGIWHREDACLVGMVSLEDIDYFNRSCSLSGIIGASAYRNLTVFIEAATLIIAHGFETLNLNRICSGSIREDEQFIYTRILGFTKEGINRHAVYKRGRYHDAILHSILRSEYKSYNGLTPLS